MRKDREFDIILYGASGYTGRLIAKYLSARTAQDADFSWALAGRNADKIRKFVVSADLPSNLPILRVDSSDESALATMSKRAAVVIGAVGPYQLHGEGLLLACIRNGTDYVDLCGEIIWMRKMIDLYSDAARSSGSRILFSCGFDSVPFDLGVYLLQKQAKKQFGKPFSEVRTLVRSKNIPLSGGTVATFLATISASSDDPAAQSLLQDPFALTPAFRGIQRPAALPVYYEASEHSWAAPFIMSMINVPNIHLSNALLGHAYGKDFVYTEAQLTGPGDEGEAAAHAVSEMLACQSLGDAEYLKPGDGPTQEELDTGSFDLLFSGEFDDGTRIRVNITGNKDPGYGATAGIISECALALIDDDLSVGGGVWTPASLMAEELMVRLSDHAGLAFRVY